MNKWSMPSMIAILHTLPLALRSRYSPVGTTQRRPKQQRAHPQRATSSFLSRAQQHWSPQPYTWSCWLNWKIMMPIQRPLKISASGHFQELQVCADIVIIITKFNNNVFLVSIISGLIILLLFLSELSFYLKTEVQPQLYVDTSRGEKLRINFDVVFPALPCACKLTFRLFII